ncbi:MAG TPA: hypothetical protein VER17_05890 [Tepidisphaeraceae bacterium]|nr:hypothetical protein [Tepidisphaeraceae bacterium]
MRKTNPIRAGTTSGLTDPACPRAVSREGLGTLAIVNAQNEPNSPDALATTGPANRCGRVVDDRRTSVVASGALSGKTPGR